MDDEGGTDDTTTAGGEERIGGYRMMATETMAKMLYNANDERRGGESRTGSAALEDGIDN
ncbi:hypothetical protein PG993_001025 [Apiospora rasikravindrae]|uniref:Uncharacterized protein n=1 Tax=Apiospora rasikravindrae TaxID=990691 RepID=A0ABR1UA81_9PEZI